MDGRSGGRLTRNPSPIARCSAGLCAVALAVALFGSPLRVSAVDAAGDPAGHEIAAIGLYVGAAPSTSQRGRLAPAPGPLTPAQALEASAHAASTLRRSQLTGVVAPALARWRLAHSTATSSP
jgi:hypothetical protein